MDINVPIIFNKANLNNRIYDVVSLDQLCALPNENFDPKFTAVEFNGNILPLRTTTTYEGPGIYIEPNNPISRIYNPETPEDKEIYKKNDSNYINFNDTNNIKELIDKQNDLKTIEKNMLVTEDNIFMPIIGDDDSPEMAGLKTAVIKKNIDIDRYEHRFTSNYSNDKRLFKDNNITLFKMKNIMKALDMKATLIIEDASPDVPNPIGEQIVIDLISSDNMDGEE